MFEKIVSGFVAMLIALFAFVGFVWFISTFPVPAFLIGAAIVASALLYFGERV